jgi:predicted acylesterase/phospholipase RssA
MTQQAVPHLAPDEIRHLALEGGGGKGFAYLGAIQVLEDLGVMSHIDGISGTSAGAITALMLSTHMTAKDIQDELLQRDYNTFFDPPLDRRGNRLVPAPFEYETRLDNSCETALLTKGFDPVASARAWACLKINTSTLAQAFGAIAGAHQLTGVIGPILPRLLASLVESRWAPVAALLRGLPHYLVYFDRDMGFFSGKAARDYFDLLLRTQAVKVTGDRTYATARASMPFGIHKRVFGTDLLLCGANLSTGKSVLFSWKHTPYFPVADAVRISMGLPLAYKPYVINQRVPGWPPCGTYIDGGIWNNLPFREIGGLADLPPREAQSQTVGTSLKTASDRRSTLGLRLGIDEPERVLRGGQLMEKFLSSGLTAGESQVIADLEPFTIVLDTTGLELLQFRPDEATQRVVTPRSRRRTYLYFGRLPPEVEGTDLETLRAQEEDERRARERMERTVCG